MHGRSTPLIVAAAIGLTIAGCAVQKEPPAPVSPTAQQSHPAQPTTAQAVKPAPAPSPAPATRSAAAPKPAPAPHAATPDAAAAGRTYSIKPGDKLWNISKEVYGDGTKYQRILDANPGLNPDNMKPGTKIVIP